MDAFTLAAKLVLDSSEYDENLKDAEQNATNSGAIISTAFKSVAAAATAITGATAAISTAFIKSTGDVAAYGDNIDKMSQKMGMSAQAYQEWDAVMQHSGTSMETLKASMKTLANAAQTGSDAFKQLGISQEEIAKLSQEELFSRTITALQNVTDETQRTYLAGKTLGRGATELGALLNTSAEDMQKMKDRVHELGGVMSNEAVKAAAAYQDSLQDMTTAFDGLKRNMVSEFLPTVTTVMDGLTDLFAGDSEKGLGLINKGIQGFADNLTDVLPKVLDTGTKIVISLADAVTQNLPALLDAGANAAAELATGIVKNLPSVVDAGMEAVLSLADGISDNLPELIPAATDAVIKIADTLTQPDNVSRLMDAGIKLTSAMLEGVIEGVPKLVDAATNAITEIAQTLTDPDRLSELLDAGVNMIGAILEGVVQAVPQLVNSAIDAAGNLLSALPGLQGFGEFLKEHKELVEAAAAAWVVYKAATAIGNVVSAATTAISGLVTAIQAQITALSGATAAQTALNVVMAAAPFAGLAVAVTAVATEFTFFYKEIFEVSDAIKELQNTQADLEATIATGHTSRDVELNQLQLKADRYEELRKVENRTAGQENELKALAGELQSVLGDDVQVIDQVTGAYNNVSAAVDNYIDAMKREAKVNAYKETLTEIYKEIAKAEEQLEKRADEHAKTNWGFWQSIETTNFINEQNATRDIIKNYESDIDRIMQGIGDVYEEASNDIDNIYTKSTTLAQDLANQRLASYAPAKSIPTEALRQQQGGAAPTFTLLPSLTKPIEDAAKEGSRLITAASKAASSTAKKTLNFATKAIGEYRNLGIDKFATLGKTLSEEQKRMQEIAKTVWNASRDWVENEIKSNQLNYQEQADAWTKVRDQFVVNSEQWIAANEKASEASKKMGDEQEKAADKLIKANEKAFDEAEKAIDKLTDAYDKAFKKEKQTIMSSYGLFDEVPKSVQISGDQLLKNLTGQNNSIKKFYSDVDKLAARGVSFELVEEIRNMGVKAGNELGALLDMTDKQLQKYDKLFRQRDTMSHDIAKANLEPLEQSTIQQIAEITDEALADIANNGKEIGESLASGMTVGMQESMTTVAQQVKDTAMAAWKEAFGTTDMTSIGTIAPELTSNATVNNDNKFTFNINGIQYQTITQLAKAVANEMQFLTNRRKAGYAGT